MSGSRRALAHRDPEADIGEPHPALRIDQALPVELIDRRLGQHHHVVDLVGLDLGHDGGGRADGEDGAVSGLLSEFLGERHQRAFGRARRQHPHLGGRSHAGEPQQR